MDPFSNCPNCKHVLDKNDNFCSNCGQKNGTNKIPFKYFIVEFIESLFNLDTKIWNTLILLFKSPGLLIKDYNDNIRVRFVAPVRLYFIVSIVFFLVIDNGVKKQFQSVDKALKKEVVKGFHISIFSTTYVDSLTHVKLLSIENITEAKVDSVLKLSKIRSNTLNNIVIRQLIRLKKKEIAPEEILQSFLFAFNKIFFLLMPIFALLIWLFCGRKKLFYSEALVFSLYFHSFYLLLMIIATLINKVINIENINTYVYFLAGFYLFTSIKYAFQKSWLNAFLLSLIITIVYSAIFGLVFILAIVTSFIL